MSEPRSRIAKVETTRHGNGEWQVEDLELGFRVTASLEAQRLTPNKEIAWLYSQAMMASLVKNL